MGKHLLLDWLFVSIIKTGTGHIRRLGKLSIIGRLTLRTTEDYSSSHIMRVLPVYVVAQFRPDG